MDKIFIRSLEVHTIIGIHEHEQETPQRLIVDLEMGNDSRVAASSRDIGDALDYQAVIDRLLAHLDGSRCLLIETLAEDLAAIVRDEFSVPWLRLSLTKPDAFLGSTEVGVIIERGELPTR